MKTAHTRRQRPAANTEAIEDYAKTIHALSRREDGPVGTSALAERLGVSPGTVTAMLKRMAELGLVEHRPYHGVELTEAGERVALEVIRHHRLIEAYLAEALGMPWDRVHDEAEVLEHYISEELEERIASALGDPSRDPHGDPIPDRELEMAAERGTPLVELQPGDSATFSRVSTATPRCCATWPSGASAPAPCSGSPSASRLEGRCSSTSTETCTWSAASSPSACW